MTDFSLKAEGFAGVIDALRDSIEQNEDAVNGAVYEAAQATMDEIQRDIWVDTGDLKASAFVAKEDIEETGEVVLGYVAPYAPIVEVVHPTRPNYIARTFNTFVPQMETVFGETLANLVEGEQGLDAVAERYPEQGEFRNSRGQRGRGGR